MKTTHLRFFTTCFLVCMTVMMVGCNVYTVHGDEEVPPEHKHDIIQRIGVEGDTSSILSEAQDARDEIDQVRILLQLLQHDKLRDEIQIGIAELAYGFRNDHERVQILLTLIDRDDFSDDAWHYVMKNTNKIQWEQDRDRVSMALINKPGYLGHTIKEIFKDPREKEQSP
ncbi:hypothetical protein [Poriferisphaera sp. WC338]|uniref:hypothetical protein n=1 Tax=Poriferisphaera sp. WC338 TaxID=3425129 RepID=UPI003D819260